MTELPLKSITKDDDIYPRVHESQKTIDSYVEALKAGAKFPPIVVQKISVNGKESTIMLDGLHRLRAYEKEKKNTIETEYWKDEVLDKEEWLNELRLESAKCNATHGDRLTQPDKERVATNIARSDLRKKWTEQRIADALGVARTTIHNWIARIRAEQDASRDSFIYKLRLLGWTQEEIVSVEKINVDTQQAVSDVLQKLSELTKLVKEDYENKKPIDEIAKYYRIDLPLVWALILEGKSDEERNEILKVSMNGDEPGFKKFTVWNFSEANSLMGRDEFKGRIPGQVPYNAIHYFSKQGDLVVDPMAGGGTTIAACLLLGRRCYAYDINPFRDDIIRHDIDDEGGLPLKKKADFIFVNPPYWNMFSYGVGASEKTISGFYETIRNLALHSYNALKDGKYMAIIMGNQSAREWLDRTEETKKLHRLDHALRTYKIFIDQGFKLYWRIYCPQPTQDAQRWAVKEWDVGRLADITRELLIFKKG